MKNIFVLILSVVLISFLLSGCFNEEDNIKNNEGSQQNSEDVNKEDAQSYDNEVNIDVQPNFEEDKNDTKSLDSSIGTTGMRMADEVKGNVHLTWKNTSDNDCDGIQVCRSDNADSGYNVIATITDINHGFYSNGYIDEGAAGNGYYYAVRQMKKESYGKISNFMKSSVSGNLWYKNGSGYLCAILESGKYHSFKEYNLTGNIIWNCDWPVVTEDEVITWYVDGEEHSRSFQYGLATPIEYNEINDQEFTYYINMDDGSFTYTMYHYDPDTYLPVFRDTKYSTYN